MKNQGEKKKQENANIKTWVSQNNYLYYWFDRPIYIFRG